MMESDSLPLRLAVCAGIGLVAVVLIEWANPLARPDVAQRPGTTEEPARLADPAQRVPGSPPLRLARGSSPVGDDPGWAAIRDALGAGQASPQDARDPLAPPGWRDKLDAMIEGYYASTTDREIIEELVERTQYTREELEDVDDLKAFLKRNAEVLLGGHGSESADGQLGDFKSEIAFSRRVDLDNSPRLVQTEFGPETRKVYAVFPSQDISVDHVTVVWRDLDRQKILIYRRYPIEAEQDNSFVWFVQPEAWPVGEYAVEIYTGDEAMNPIAMGSYFVTSN